MNEQPRRCTWCGNDPLYRAYHDEEWGVPVHDDRLLFEMLILEGAQAGLSWLTILRKRDNYERAFDNFEVQTVARYGQPEIDRLAGDSGIVRNRLKIAAAIKNARAVLQIQDRHGSLDSYLWQFVDYRPIQNSWPSLSQVPVRSTGSDIMSKSLKAQGCSFVGSTICYAFMQATGMVNDHIVDCFRHREIRQLAD